MGVCVGTNLAAASARLGNLCVCSIQTSPELASFPLSLLAEFPHGGFFVFGTVPNLGRQLSSERPNLGVVFRFKRRHLGVMFRFERQNLGPSFLSRVL